MVGMTGMMGGMRIRVMIEMRTARQRLRVRVVMTTAAAAVVIVVITAAVVVVVIIVVVAMMSLN